MIEKQFFYERLLISGRFIGLSFSEKELIHFQDYLFRK